MKPLVLTAAVLGVLALAADRARADGALSRPMAAHVAAKYNNPAAHNSSALRVQQVSHHGYPGYHGYSGHHRSRGGGAVIVSPYVPYVPSYPTVVVPYAYPYGYYQPYRSFYYSSPRFSVGFGW
jgi:hypothetical protein